MLILTPLACVRLVDLLQRLLHEVEVLNRCVNSISEPEKKYSEKINKKNLYIELNTCLNNRGGLVSH